MTTQLTTFVPKYCCNIVGVWGGGETAWETWKVIVSSECNKVFLNKLTVVQTVKKLIVNTPLKRAVLALSNSSLYKITLKTKKFKIYWLLQ